MASTTPPAVWCDILPYAAVTTAAYGIICVPPSTTPQPDYSAVPPYSGRSSVGTPETLTSESATSPVAGLPRRSSLQRRMPKRERIQAVIDRLPSRDPWLDDQHDWTP